MLVNLPLFKLIPNKAIIH